MDLSDDSERAAWHDRLGGVFRGRRVVCALAPLAGWTETVRLLAEVGAARPLLLATAVGAGPVPGLDEADVVMLDLPSTRTLTEEVRRQDQVVRHLPPEVVAAVEAYDPDGAAVWLVSPFISTAPLLDREVRGGRPAAWFALEDKLAADAVWDAVGLPRAGRRFVYGGLGTTWDPPEQDRAAMRERARRTGEHLRGLVGYRGAFGIDGILGVDGFRPIELNSRMSAGITSMAGVVDASAFFLLQHALTTGTDPGDEVATLEAWAVPAMDAALFDFLDAELGTGFGEVQVAPDVRSSPRPRTRTVRSDEL